MAREIKESDWKIYRKLHPIVLDRYCQAVIAEIDKIERKSELSYHQKYLEIFALMRSRDKEIALLFDDPRRSNAVDHIMGLKSRDLLTDEEFGQFSVETQALIIKILEIYR